MKEITVVVMGSEKRILEVGDNATWAEICMNHNLDSSMTYKLRGANVDPSYVPAAYDTFIATKNIKGGV